MRASKGPKLAVHAKVSYPTGAGPYGTSVRTIRCGPKRACSGRLWASNKVIRYKEYVQVYNSCILKLCFAKKLNLARKSTAAMSATKAVSAQRSELYRALLPFNKTFCLIYMYIDIVATLFTKRWYQTGVILSMQANRTICLHSVACYSIRRYRNYSIKWCHQAPFNE